MGRSRKWGGYRFGLQLALFYKNWDYFIKIIYFYKNWDRNFLNWGCNWALFYKNWDRNFLNWGCNWGRNIFELGLQLGCKEYRNYFQL